MEHKIVALTELKYCAELCGWIGKEGKLSGGNNKYDFGFILSIFHSSHSSIFISRAS
jgi:hypothetical protein